MKKFFFAVFSVIVILFLAFVGFMTSGTKSILTGYSLKCNNGAYMIIEESGSPIRYSYDKATGTSVEKLEQGDRILIISDGINETYPGSTRAYFILKYADGDIEDIPGETLSTLEEMGWYN